MSEADPTGDDAGKFEVQLPDDQVLSKGDIVEHVEHGPMVVGQVRYGGTYKTVQLQSELGPEGLQLSGDDVRQQWGETLAFDPATIRDQAPRAELNGISLPDDGYGVEVDLTVQGGNPKAVEAVTMYLQDRAVRAMQALDEEAHPDEVEGTGNEFDWAAIVDSVNE